MTDIQTTVPFVISLEQLQTSTQALQVQEAGYASQFSAIWNPNQDSLHASLLQWTSAGFPDIYVIMSFPVTLPPICSDGVTRNIYDYFTFCSGRTIVSAISQLQSFLTGINVSYIASPTTISICVSKSQ